MVNIAESVVFDMLQIFSTLEGGREAVVAWTPACPNLIPSISQMTSSSIRRTLLRPGAEVLGNVELTGPGNPGGLGEHGWWFLDWFSNDRFV